VSLLTLGSRLLEQVGLKRRGSPLTREQAFDARPVRNPSLKWRLNDEDSVEVIIPRRGDRLGRALGFLFYVPQSRPVVLDEVGSRVWTLCDGERTVEEIVETLRGEYKLGRREVEVSLTEYLRTLGKRGMIGFLVPEELARELGEEGKDLVGLPGVSTSRELEQARAQAPVEDEEADEDQPDDNSAESGPDEDSDDE